MSMSIDGLLLNGSRPPSVLSNHKPIFFKHQGYFTVAKKSSVDELLFRSQYTTKLEAVSHCKDSWKYRKPPKSQNERKDKIKGPPLLWSPPPSGASHVKQNKKLKQDSSEIYLWSTKQHYRQLKYTPTFVDESLFGSRKEDHCFEASWSESEKEKKEPKNFYGQHKNRQISEIKHTNHNCSKQLSSKILDRPFWKP